MCSAWVGSNEYGEGAHVLGPKWIEEPEAKQWAHGRATESLNDTLGGPSELEITELVVRGRLVSSVMPDETGAPCVRKTLAQAMRESRKTLTSPAATPVLRLVS